MQPEIRRFADVTAPFGKGLLVLALLAGVLSPAAAHAQEATSTEEPLTRPLEVLLQQRDTLGLTSDQLGELGRIQDRLATTNEPLVNQMMELRTQWQQQRRAARNGRPPNVARIEEIRSAAERLQQQIQANNRAAMKNVNGLLTPPQRKQLRGIVEKRRQQNTGKRGANGARSGGGR